MLRVSDDGAGMPPEPVESQGLGLRIMHYRAAMIGATLTIEANKPRGIVISCLWPKQNHVQKKNGETGPRARRR